MSGLDDTHFTAVCFFTLLAMSIHNESSDGGVSGYIGTAVLCICPMLHAKEDC